MSGAWERERIENWAADFCVSDWIRPFAPAVRDHAAPLLAGFLQAACDRRGRDPEDVEEEDLRAALLDHLARQQLDPAVREQVPALCGAFLEFQAAEGRLAAGRDKGAFVRALRTAWRGATGQKDTLARRGGKVERNGPCPCGSGRKYKKCCMNLIR